MGEAVIMFLAVIGATVIGIAVLGAIANRYTRGPRRRR